MFADESRFLTDLLTHILHFPTLYPYHHCIYLHIYHDITCKAIMKKEKNKKRGRNKISAKLRRKQKNVVDAQTIKLKVSGVSVNLSVYEF